MLSKKINFIPSSEECELVVPRPKPSKNYIPEWYKDIPPTSKKLKFNQDSSVSNLSIRSCMPFLDSYRQGYIQETWTDIYISSDGEQINYNWANGPVIMSHRDAPTGFRSSNLFYDIEFVWREPWIPKTPKGYSVLYTSPLNRFDLPFRSLDAIIDSDFYHHAHSGNYPFYIQKGFTGLIPAGTPMYQIILIKRDKWVSFQTKYNYKKQTTRGHELKKYYTDGYKKLFWQKKHFD